MSTLTHDELIALVRVVVGDGNSFRVSREDWRYVSGHNPEGRSDVEWSIRAFISEDQHAITYGDGSTPEEAMESFRAALAAHGPIVKHNTPCAADDDEVAF